MELAEIVRWNRVALRRESNGNGAKLLNGTLKLATYALLLLAAALVLLPFAYLVCGSLKTSDDAFRTLFLPTGDGFLGIAWDRLTLANYANLFAGRQSGGQLNVGVSLFNSIFLASTTSVLATLTSALGGYALAKFRFAGREFLSNFVLSTLVIPGVLLLAPTYQLLYWLGLLDSYAGLILPAMAPAFGVYLFRQAMLTSVPSELLEAARIDGCGELRIFFAIALPLVRPMLAAFLMITFLATWNNFIGPQIVLQSPEKFPLAVTIAQLKGVYSQDFGLLMAGTVVSIAPVMLLFLMLQKEFIAGMQKVSGTVY